jgi:mannosyltransferase OCH1-like enzyme
MSDIKKYKDIKGRKWTESGIPKWIFRTGGLEYEDLSFEITTLYSHILNNNPEYELFYFSDKDCVKFILEEYGQEYLNYYNTLIPTAYKADLFRYCLLNKYGGCYGDFTLLPLISYNEIIQGVDRVFVRDDGSGVKGSLWNALMCTKAADPILSKSIEISINHIKIKYFGNNPLDVTGPTVLGEAFRQVGYNPTHQFDISLGDNGGSRIYVHDINLYVRDVNDRNIIIKKIIDIHNSNLYGEKNVHYDTAWYNGEIYRKTISYAITVWNEHKELDRLLCQLKSIVKWDDEIVIQMDIKATDDVREVIKNHGLTAHVFPIGDSFATFKNNLTKLCTKDYIFQLDADEFLSDDLSEKIDDVIRINSDVDALIIPRVNTLVDQSMLEEYMSNLTWKNDESSWINYPDAQTRIFKNKSKIVWGGDRIHTYLINLDGTRQLEKQYQLIHVKSFQKQQYQYDFYETF